MIPAPKTFKLSKPELKAKKVLEECGLDDATELPIANIILGRNAFYEERPLAGKDGEIIALGGKSMITVNADIAFESRKRFAAAHELAIMKCTRASSRCFLTRTMIWLTGSGRARMKWKQMNLPPNS